MTPKQAAATISKAISRGEVTAVKRATDTARAQGMKVSAVVEIDQGMPRLFVEVDGARVRPSTGMWFEWEEAINSGRFQGVRAAWVVVGIP